jgi:hypothetical protein
MMFVVRRQSTKRKGNAMNKFIEKFGGQIQGVLAGFDRLVFRGTLRRIVYDAGMKSYLWQNQVLLKDFGKHVERTSQQLKAASLQAAGQAGRPVQYLPSNQVSKEEIARGIAAKDQIQQGLVCVLTSVEPCWSFEVGPNRETKKLELAGKPRKCLFLYHYWMHPEFGFMNARIQTWFPFSIQICLNGREWLARQLDQAGIGCRRHDNCFSWIEDYARAQRLMDEQLRVNWPLLLDGVASQLNPIHERIFAHFPASYYWSTYQSEWAMDLVFGDPGQLRRLYPQLVQLGMTSFSSPDVMRFLGKRVNQDGTVPANLTQEVTTDLKRRAEGVRIKHRLGQNSIKLYDKAYTEQAAVLRPEVTINDPAQFKVYRPKEGDPQGELAWRQMRRGIADLHRRAEVSQKALDRYCDALAGVDDSTTLEELTARIERRTKWNGTSVRALHPFDPGDCALLEAVNRGEFTINGLRNRDLQRLLYSTPATDQQKTRQRSAAISRKLRLLRAHGLIQKLPHTHRYQVTENGRLILNAILSARHATINQLIAKAA